MGLESVYLRAPLLLVEPKIGGIKNTGSNFITVAVVNSYEGSNYNKSDVLIVPPKMLTEWVVDEQVTDYFLINEEFVKAKV